MQYLPNIGTDFLFQAGANLVEPLVTRSAGKAPEAENTTQVRQQDAYLQYTGGAAKTML